jgi:hypothetical protein
LPPADSRARGVIAIGRRACEASGVSRNHGPPPRLSEAELPAVTPPEIIGVRGADGQRGLDLRDGEYERVYSLPDQYTRLMFIALCRQEGVLVYMLEAELTSYTAPELTSSDSAKILELSS